MEESIAAHLNARMRALGGLSFRDVARRVMAVEGRDPDSDHHRFDEWRDRVSDYSAGKEEPQAKTIRILAAALEDDPADWPPRRKGPTVRSLDVRLEELEVEVDLWKGVLLEALTLLGLQYELEADPGSRVRRRTPRRHRAAGGHS